MTIACWQILNRALWLPLIAEIFGAIGEIGAIRRQLHLRQVRRAHSDYVSTKFHLVPYYEFH